MSQRSFVDLLRILGSSWIRQSSGTVFKGTGVGGHVLTCGTCLESRAPIVSEKALQVWVLQPETPKIICDSLDVSGLKGSSSISELRCYRHKVERRMRR